MKKKSISKLKKELDKWFSLYIRLRFATKTGLAKCVTCGTVKHYKQMQNSHFQSRRFMATRWHDINCQVGCVKCNVFNYGEQFKFAVYLNSTYGYETAEDLQHLAQLIIKMSRIDYEEKIAYYKSLVNKIKKQKGIE
tara:strand:+ start:176 stop:586 length:411 start_codon:yes stop_codon:yes gene_type:complete